MTSLKVERVHCPADRRLRAPIARSLIEGSKTALLTILVYIVALPIVFFAGIGMFVFFFATAYLLGREYFELAAMRFHSVEEAKAMRRQNASTVFAAGCFIAAFVSIPILNLATPLFGMAFMVHIHKRLSGPRPELLDAQCRRGAVSIRPRESGTTEPQSTPFSGQRRVADDAALAQRNLRARQV